MLITPEYKLQLAGMHARGAWGGAGKSWADAVWKLCRQLDAVTVLDYGCGTGSLKPALLERDPRLMVHEHDPGVPGKDGEPRPAHVVAALDVLEHVEPRFVDDTVGRVLELALRGAFLVIACSPAKQVLPDGRNAHLTLNPPSWWLARLRRHGTFQVTPLEDPKHRLVAVLRRR